MNRTNNKILCKETVALSNELSERYPDQVRNSVKKTIKYFDIRDMQISKEEFKEKTKIEIVDEDTADAGYALLQQGFNPLIINMASNTTPGGGWRNGAMAQEEALFYRSLYYLALEKKEKFYPLKAYECVYTPNVLFFRSSQRDGFELLPYEECCFLSCIAVPAIRKPTLKQDGTYTPAQRRMMKDKIRGIFKVGLVHKHDSLVLGALGCGAYKNPPEQVAEIFREVIEEYVGCFKHIVFAILDYGRSRNRTIFEKEFRKLKAT